MSLVPVKGTKEKKRTERTLKGEEGGGSKGNRPTDMTRQHVRIINPRVLLSSVSSTPVCRDGQRPASQQVRDKNRQFGAQIQPEGDK